MKFDGYRFYDAASSTCTARVLTASDTFLSWGQGSALCPGRALAITTVQILFAKMLLNYDVKFAGQRKEYPPNAVVKGANLTDCTVRMHIRRRKKID